MTLKCDLDLICIVQSQSRFLHTFLLRGTFGCSLMKMVHIRVQEISKEKVGTVKPL